MPDWLLCVLVTAYLFAALVVHSTLMGEGRTGGRAFIVALFWLPLLLIGFMADRKGGA